MYSRMQMLRHRELGCTTPRAVLSQSWPLHFSRLQYRYSIALQGERVVRAIAAEELLVVLFSSGLCRCYTQQSGTLVYSFDRLRVKNLYYNAASGSLVTVSSHSRVHAICHVFPLATIRNGKPKGISLRICRYRDRDDGAEAIADGDADTRSRAPSMVEFDGTNNVLLAHYIVPDRSPHACRTIDVFEMTNYTHLFSLQSHRNFEAKVGNGVLVVAQRDFPNILSLHIHAITTGKLLRTVAVVLHREHELDFVEVSDNYVLIKQFHSALLVMNLSAEARGGRELELFPELVRTKRYVLMPGRSQFLTREAGVATLWSFHAEKLLRFSDYFFTGLNVTSAIYGDHITITAIRGEVSLWRVCHGTLLTALPIPNDQSAPQVTLVCSETNSLVVATKHHLHVWQL